MRRPQAPRAAQIGVLVLALACLGLTARATFTDPGRPVPDLRGHFGDEAPKVRALLSRLGAGLLTCQEDDGGFRAGVDVNSQHNDDAERVALSALMAAALAELRALGVEVPKLDAGLSTARMYLRARQSSVGAVLGTPGGDVRLQLEATANAAWTWLVAAQSADDKSLRDAASALRRMGADGFDNGYPRALVAMWAERVGREGKQSEVLDGQPRDVVRWREYKELPKDPGFELWDASLAEAIARTTLGQFSRKRGAIDPFPTRVLKKVLANTPEWTGASTDMQGYWLQSWLAARSAEGAPWFAALATIVDEWIDDETDLLPGGYYADEVPRSAYAIMALVQGLRADP